MDPEKDEATPQEPETEPEEGAKEDPAAGEGQDGGEGVKDKHGVGLPVRTTLLQNLHVGRVAPARVGLPVRTTLLQNVSAAGA